MRIRVSYSRVYKDFFAVYVDGRYVGDVRKYPDGWVFTTCSKPIYVSPAFEYRLQAVMSWSGLVGCDIWKPMFSGEV